MSAKPANRSSLMSFSFLNYVKKVNIIVWSDGCYTFHIVDTYALHFTLFTLPFLLPTTKVLFWVTNLDHSAGTLATCCNPSRGALSFGWILLRLLGWCEPGHMIGDRHKAPERFYHLATIPGRWNSRNDEARGVGRKWSHKSLIAWIARSRVRFTRGRLVAAFSISR